ncbi:MAG TPA: hypothetical protein VGR73_16760 [Bryobacteraceae bacterium]|nr:hypothetical protein [Bryobacteraceae bacterium]
MTRRKLAWMAAAAAGIALLPAAAFAQAPASSQAKSAPAAPARAAIPRLTDGKPNLNGIWQAMNTANWDLVTHGPSQGPAAFGTFLTTPPGLGVVEGDAIPYLPDAAIKKKENYANRWIADPELKCYLPGVPRATYMPYPFEIVQSTSAMLIAYEYAEAVRTINMGKPKEAPVDSWMGWSNGHWEGDTLVIDVTGMNDMSWLDRAGDFHSDALHVVERYTPVNAALLNYEATLDDISVYSKPWKISMPLYRHMEKNARRMEFKCAEFAEELLYGPLRRKPNK